jgi:hypothetical protein
MVVPAPSLEEQKRKIETLETQMKKPAEALGVYHEVSQVGLTLRQAATGAWRFLSR